MNSKILEASSISELAILVNKELKNDYDIVGGVSCSPTKTGSLAGGYPQFNYAQTVIKR